MFCYIKIILILIMPTLNKAYRQLRTQVLEPLNSVRPFVRNIERVPSLCNLELRQF
jgi:hypothetical protein